MNTCCGAGRLALLALWIVLCCIAHADDPILGDPPNPANEQFDGSFRLNTPMKPVELQLAASKIGVLATHGLTQAEVRIMAATMKLKLDRAIGQDLYILSAATALDQDDRWAFARRLKSESQGKLRAAGLLAKRAGSPDWLMVDDTIYVRFKPAVDAVSKLDGIPDHESVKTPFGENEWKLVLDPHISEDPLDVAKALAADPDVIYAHPDIAQRLKIRSTDSACTELTLLQMDVPGTGAIADRGAHCDGGYPSQWHLDNPGEWGLEDADADVREAWDIFTQVDHGTMIAVIDFGFHTEHWDLKPNLWEENGKLGIALIEGVSNPPLLEWPGGDDHGTKAAGVAAARGGNTYHGGGVAGACPKCKMLLIRVPKTILTGDMKDAFKQAVDKGADVISMSLGFTTVTENIEYDLAEYTTQEVEDNISDLQDEVREAVNAGLVVVFPMDNDPVDHCIDDSDSSALSSVIAVGGVTDWDQRTSTGLWQARGFGDCMDVVAPTGGGTKHITSTSVNWSESAQAWQTDFRHDFHGNSAGTPLVAGIAALMHNVLLEPAPIVMSGSAPVIDRPWPLQVQLVLQDTADKVDPCGGQNMPCQFHYDAESGFSQPGTSSTHAYGRISAFEAVRLVAPVLKGGRGNKDLLLRDHQLDWGNTEQPSDTLFTNPREKVEQLQSVDIKLGASPCPVIDPATALADFIALQHADPLPDEPSCVYVRVRNRGQYSVENATLSLNWALFEDALPDLPVDFWEKFLDISFNPPVWKRAGLKDLKDLSYSGASAAGCPQRAKPDCLGEPGTLVDGAQVVALELAPIIWAADNQRLALLAVVHSGEDPVQALSDKVPGDLDVLSVLSGITLDNNITIFVTASQEGGDTCPDWLKNLLILLIFLAIAVLLYILYLMFTNKSVPAGFVVLFFLILVALAYITWLCSST